MKFSNRPKLRSLLGLFFLATSVYSSSALGIDHDASFERWKNTFVAKWGRREVPAKFIRASLKPITRNPAVIEIDRNQVTSSKTLSYPKFMTGWVNSDPHRIQKGRELLKKHGRLLEKIEAKYGVDKEAIVALWGVETLYGNNKGGYDVIQSLATLAHEGRRKKFFEIQLFTALKILHQGHITPDKFLGSWSGALGHCQFMPSSFERIAVDFDGDGKKDIWNNLPDVFASIANYLKKAKWQKGLSVGDLAYASGEIDFNLDRPRTPSALNELGLRTADGKEFTGSWTRTAESIPLKDAPYVLRGSNYMSIMRWNNSSLFAAFTITLMDALQSPSPDESKPI